MENKNSVVVVLILSLKMRVGEKINKTGPSQKGKGGECKSKSFEEK
jgi:hypothetical protein